MAVSEHKDWTGNKTSVHATLGSRNVATQERVEHDYYATEPAAVEMLLELERFGPTIWEPACGQGHISKVLEKHGYTVISSDLVDRGYGLGGIDFLQRQETGAGVDIITNPPYKYGMEFVENALAVVGNGHKVAMFLKLQFLEGKSRGKLFEKLPPKTVYVSRSRLRCARNGDFEEATNSTAVAYCWFVWEKGYAGDTVIKWFN